MKYITKRMESLSIFPVSSLFLLNLRKKILEEISQKSPRMCYILFENQLSNKSPNQEEAGSYYFRVL